MRAPVSWLAEHVDLPAALTPRELGDALLRVGMEVERVESGADGLSGPLVVGRVLGFEDEPQKNGKTIRWCQVDVGEGEPRGIVCGASNFAAGDLVVVSLPGAVLPGGFAITARKTYGHVSDGMICSVRELGIGDDHEGILVLVADALDQPVKPGDDALDVLGLREGVLDIAVTTDRGYCMSIRGLAREAAAALAVAFHDVDAAVPPADGGAYPVIVEDPAGCDRFSARAVTGLDPTAPTPAWMSQRLRQCGVRSISLAVDVTNYVMLETGQPLHAFDRAKLSGTIGVRRARPGERLTTLDGVERRLDPDDLVVTDGTGAIALAGTMGGASTEIGPATTEILLEAAHWDPGSITRTARRHKLPSEASRRFERGVDPEIAGVALQRCVDLLVEHGGATAVPGHTVVGDPPAPPVIVIAASHPQTLAGMPIPTEDVVAHLTAVGCAVEGVDASEGASEQMSSAPPGARSPAPVLRVRPPTWRPDLLQPTDLVEEVVRLAGYDNLPSVLPVPLAGHGLSADQRLHRDMSRALASAGLVETLSYPFVSAATHDAFGLPADDPRRNALHVVNPLSDAEPELRTSLLPGLLATVVRNVGRGSRDLAIFEAGLVFERSSDPATIPAPAVTQRPSPEQIAELYAAVPRQPRRIAAAFAGDLERPGWWGAGRAATWADAVEAAQVVARAARVHLDARPAQHPPWHPGRCAQLLLDDVVVGYAGELQPRVVAALGLPPRTCAMELDVDAFRAPAPAAAPHLSTFPPVLLDVALVVDAAVTSAAVLAALRGGAGELLESARLFDVYVDESRLGPGVKSLAFALRFRAPDRTLTVEEANAMRDAAVAAAADRTGARLRT